MVSCYQNATGIELLDDYCFVIHNQASPDEIPSIAAYIYYGTHCPADHTFNHSIVYFI